MPNDDAFFFQGLPPTAIPQTLTPDNEQNLANEAVLRAKDEARSAKALAEDDAARRAAWSARMAILDE